MRYTFFLPLLSAVLASNPPAAYGQSDSASMKLGDITVTGTLRLRAYAWDWFTPATGNNNYAYSGNLLRLNFVEKHKGWDWDAELAASLLLGMPDNANAAAPQGALGLGSNYYSANGNRQYSGTVFAKQLYGRQNLEMNNALQQLGASVTPIVLYRWELPTDVEPLQMAARGLAQRRFDVVLFTSSIQLDHLMMVAKALGLELQVSSALREYTAIASVGPVMTASLEAAALPVEIVPLHPKMGALVKAASEGAAAILAQKRGH